PSSQLWRQAPFAAVLQYRGQNLRFSQSFLLVGSPHMSRIAAMVLAILLSNAAHAAEYMEKTPFQLSRAFSPAVVTSGGMIVWIAGQTATQDSQGNNIANNFEAQVKQVFSQIDGVMKH